MIRLGFLSFLVSSGFSIPATHVFGPTVNAFLLAEKGVEARIATAAPSARDADVVQVVPGTPFGMMRANVAAAFLGHGITRSDSTKRVHAIAAPTLAMLGVLTLPDVGALF